MVSMGVVALYRQTKKVSDTQIKKASDDELQELKILLDSDLSEINLQLTEAKQKAARYGEYSSPEWFRQATTARNIRARFSQMIQLEQSKRRKKRREAQEFDQIQKKNLRSFADCLMDAMDLLLCKEDKIMVIRKAREIWSEEGPPDLI